MPFDNMTDRLRRVAVKSLDLCKERYGGAGLVVEGPIDDSISWRPTFHLRPSRIQIVAVEVNESLYPSVLRGAAHEINQYDEPICVYQACSLDSYQADRKQSKIAMLRNNGFGIITVDDDGRATMQHASINLAQNISPDTFEEAMKPLTPKGKVVLRGAYATYTTNEGQGLQQVGQIVEGTVMSLAGEANKKAIISTSLNSPLADLIDALYETNEFKPHRAALGKARSFTKEFRNVASHAPKTAKEAAQKIRKCRSGFLEGISVFIQLRSAAKALGLQVHVHAT
jgi:hypothetical protein